MVSDYLTPDEVGELLRISGQTVRKMLRESHLDGLKIGSTWRVSRESVEAFIAANTHKAKPIAPKGQPDRDIPMRIV